jgi:ubiquinone/menaquinone biosynthesis C-methylase UbiE
VKQSWDAVASEPAPSWYLDPLVAEQKRSIHKDLVERWTQGLHPRTVLKTDLFEEAFGQDRVLFDLVPGAAHVVGMDIASPTVHLARKHCSGNGFSFLVADVRNLALRSDTFDLVFSNSTLDHFDSQAELRASLGELARTVRPGGLLIVTLDNPSNPLYPVVRWLSRREGAPFFLGATASADQLALWMQEFGLQVTGQDWLIHNPRLLSTALFLVLRRILGARADAPIRALLGWFAAMGTLSRRRTACFLAVCARKPAA